MMTCDQLEIWISTYQDGELDPRRRRLVEEHLAGCSACRALSDQLAALTGTLRAGLERWDPPETLHTHVMHRIPQPKSVPAGGRTPRGWLSFGLVPAGLMAAWLLMMKPPVMHPPAAVQKTTPPPVQMVTTPSPSGQKQAGPAGRPPLQAGNLDNGGIMRVTTPPDHGEVHPAPVQKTKPTGQQASPARPTGTGGARRAPRTERELEPLRRLLKSRRPRWQEYMASGHQRRPRMLIAKGTEPTQPIHPKRADTRPPRITVVDYVLPEVPPPAAEQGSKSKTEFVLRAAEPYQVSQASYDY
jgi:Putative zinc-finger